MKRPLPAAADHAPVSVLNHGPGVRTLIKCSCGQAPKRGSERGSMRHVWHAGHRRRLGLPRLATYAGEVFGEGPWTGWTWDAWYAEHGASGVDPYTGEQRD